MQRGAPGQGRLDHIAHVQQFRNHLPLLQERVSQGIGWVSVRTANHRADTLAWLEQTHQFQAADGVPHGTAAHAQHPNQFAFRGEQVARLHLFRNALLQSLGDLLVDFISRDRLERDSRW